MLMLAWVHQQDREKVGLSSLQRYPIDSKCPNNIVNNLYHNNNGDEIEWMESVQGLLVHHLKCVVHATGP